MSSLQANGAHWKLEDFTNLTGKQSKSFTLDAGGTLITINPGQMEHPGHQVSSQSIKPSRLQSVSSSRPSA